MEELLAGIWARVLNLAHVDVNDNFFELGGHSLLATQAISRIKDVFEVEIPLQLLFESPTVASMAASLEVAMKSDLGLRAPPIARIARDETLPLYSLNSAFGSSHTLSP